MFHTPKTMPHRATVIHTSSTRECCAISGWCSIAAIACGAGFGAATSAVGGDGFLGRHFSQYSWRETFDEHCLQTQALHAAHLPVASVFRCVLQ